MKRKPFELDKSDELWFAFQDAQNEALSAREDIDVSYLYIGAAERVQEDAEDMYNRSIANLTDEEWLARLA